MLNRDVAETGNIKNALYNKLILEVAGIVLKFSYTKTTIHEWQYETDKKPKQPQKNEAGDRKYQLNKKSRNEL